MNQNPTNLFVGVCQKIKTLKKMAVKFFISSLGNFCYTFHSRRGYPVYSIDFQKIRRLSIHDREAMNDKEQHKIESILRRRHPNAWSNLTPENVRNLNPVVINIRRKFDPQVIEQLKAAFDNRTNFRYERCGIRRDWRVETKLCDDGVFRAWFSSEFSGMLNGSYYLLINPTTAAFKEDD